MTSAPTALPRVTIKFCTQCRWMLRAAYFAQELLSTFSTALGEVALQPSSGGIFTVEIFYASLSAGSSDGDVQIQRHVLWDRKEEGGFPETKELKKRVRDIIEPGRDLGHVDGKKKSMTIAAASATPENQEQDPQQDSLLHNVRPKAITRLAGRTGGPGASEGGRKFTPMDIDVAEARDRGGEGVKRNPDGSICEDCN